MMKKSIFTILVIFISCVLFSFYTPKKRVVNICSKWGSKDCPVHHSKLVKGKVSCEVGGITGIQPADSRDYENPPYTSGENPNAKYSYYSSSGCEKEYDEAVIYYCKQCEAGRGKK